MLSPGRYYLDVPKEREANLDWRRGIIKDAIGNPRLQKALRIICRDDLLFYVNTFVNQFNPRKKGHRQQIGPFITWPFQDEAFLEMLYCIEGDHDLVIEKSREMGASWMILIVFEWLWHFHPWQKFLMISRNEKAVEDEDPDSLFWKIDFMHRWLPEWLLPKMKRRKLFYGNEDNGSTITGQASTGKAGVGGRATAMGIDEFSQIEEDYEVLHRTSDTTGCRIFNFTHKGLDTAAYELTQRVDIRKLRMHWSQHPDKIHGLYQYVTEPNPHVEVLDKAYSFPADFKFVMDGKLRSPWYDDQCNRKGDERAVAMDLDINPQGSVAQFFDPYLVNQLIAAHACEPYWEGEVKFDRETGQPEGLEKRKGGPIKLWCHLVDGKPIEGTYAAGGDISGGTGKTCSCISVANATTGEKVAEFVTPFVEPTPFAYQVFALMALFGFPRFAWEMQGPGVTFGKKIQELGYPMSKVYLRSNEMKVFDLGAAKDPPAGWYPSNENKLLLMQKYRDALRSRQFLNRSEAALQECLKFSYMKSGFICHPGQENTNDPTGAKVNHGDRTIADALCWKMVEALGVRQKKARKEEILVLSLAWRRQMAENSKREEEVWA